MTLTPVKSSLHILTKIGSIWRLTYWGRTYCLSPKRLLLKAFMFHSKNWNVQIKCLIVNRWSNNWRSSIAVH